MRKHINSDRDCQQHLRLFFIYIDKARIATFQRGQEGSEEMRSMKGNSRIFFLLFLLALIAKQASAAQHVVGGSQGWDESVDLNSWAAGQTFKVGDQLVFKYSSGLHSVVELGSETAYKNCDLGTALDSKNTGDDVVKLSKVGTRYFACGTLGHCDQGMKMKITTVAGNAPSTPASASTTSGASAVQSFATFLLLAALSGISLLYLL
ncbi:Phytocyanin domain - like 10 [Theobroma cacao]|nr:Phytocyanin domain - like 10 [Theobroma cacao]WRX21942.1 Phytocyanin domain - like 10 [Theobroma cacao]